MAGPFPLVPDVLMYCMVCKLHFEFQLISIVYRTLLRILECNIVIKYSYDGEIPMPVTVYINTEALL